MDGKQKKFSGNIFVLIIMNLLKITHLLRNPAIRSEEYKLIYFYTVNEWELYDLEKDPAEQKNLIYSPAYNTTIQV
jgi:hypothetical protein